MFSSQVGCQADLYGIKEGPGQADDFAGFQAEGSILEGEAGDAGE